MTKSIASATPEKILIIRLSSIGDIILTTPVLRLLRQRFPNSTIDFVIKRELAELLIFHPAIDQFYFFDRREKPGSLKQIKREITAERYDLILDLHKNFRSFYLSWGSKAKRIIRYRKGIIRRFFYVKFRLNFIKEIIPIYLRYLRCLEPYHIFYDDRGLEIFFDAAIQRQVLQRYAHLAANPGPLIIGVAPGASFTTKRWTAEGFSAVINYLIDEKKARIIIFGSHRDRATTNSLTITAPAAVVDTTGALSIQETGALINCCDLLITNDSGLMHIASALKKKVVAIFGSTTEQLGFFPYTTEHIVVQNSLLKCRPCSHVGRKNCPKKHFRCMKEITAEQVIEAVETLLIQSNSKIPPPTHQSDEF